MEASKPASGYVDPDDAEDVAQESFLRAWKHLRSFDPERPLPTVGLGEDRAQLPLRQGRVIKWLEEALEPLEASMPVEDRHRLAVHLDRGRLGGLVEEAVEIAGNRLVARPAGNADVNREAARGLRSVTVNLAESPLRWLRARGHIDARQFEAQMKMLQTADELPLRGRISTREIAVGADTWLLTVSARNPLVGELTKDEQRASRPLPTTEAPTEKDELRAAARRQER